MNGNCQTCPVESQCAYPYKPTDCCDQRKFKFLGVWERLNNPSFNSPGFEGIRSKAGLNRFTLSGRLPTPGHGATQCQIAANSLKRSTESVETALCRMQAGTFAGRLGKQAQQPKTKGLHGGPKI